jgi:predicted nucleotidyltransferase
MPRSVPQSELDAIYEAVARQPGGASLDEISRSVDLDLPRRTLQRRLAGLVEQGRLLSEGAGRGCRYLSLAHAGAATKRTRDQALAVLRRLKPELAERFGVTRLALFGSTARDEAAAGSDVDVVVEFDGPATSRRYFGVQFLLEDALGHPVDLVTAKALRPELRPYVEREAVDV